MAHTTWPITIKQINYDRDGNYQFLHAKEGVGEQKISIFAFPLKWRGYAQWDTVDHEHFTHIMRPGNTVMITLDSRNHLVKVSDNYKEFDIYDDYDLTNFFTHEKPQNQQITSDIGKRASYPVKRAPFMPPRMASLAPKLAPVIMPEEKKDALSFTLTMKSGASEYKHVLQLKGSPSFLTREYLFKLGEASAGVEGEQDIMLQAMLKELDMNT